MPIDRRYLLALLAIGVQLAAGCTGPREYFRNGFKVGPNYAKPAAAVAPNWIDAADRRVRNEEDDLAGWWTIFGDPTLNDLIVRANAQNLTLREAGFRILAARAQLGFASRQHVPAVSGGRRAVTAASASADNFFDQWTFGLQSRLGTRLLGPLPARRALGRSDPRRLDRRLRRRPGDAPGRRGEQLRELPHLAGTDSAAEPHRCKCRRAC
jgi:hypothetical protein